MRPLQSKKIWKRISAALVSLALFLNLGVVAHGAGDSVVALGADLNEQQRATVLGLLGLTEEELSGCTVVTVTNEQEHQYLGSYMDASVIGTRSLSSVRVTPLEEGSGLNITTHNISFCTISMYQNALVTAGLEDAEVVVAGPSHISGTAALIGAVKAYEAMTGETVSETVLETATNELVVTGQLGDLLGDSEEASQIMAYIKQMILETDAGSSEEIEAVIRDALSKFEVDLSAEDIAKVQSLMEKFSKLDIDVNALSKQAQELYGKIQDMGLDVDSEKVGNFFTNLLKEIMKFVGKLL